MASVYVINQDGTTEPMTRLRCSDENSELQLVLENNLDLIPGDQIAPEEPRRWLLIKRECRFLILQAAATGGVLIFSWVIRTQHPPL
jgi:hypothetical protein